MNAEFSPAQADYDRAEMILDAYDYATKVRGSGAAMQDGEMIDEATRKLAVTVAAKGRAAGLARTRQFEPPVSPAGVAPAGCNAYQADLAVSVRRAVEAVPKRENPAARDMLSASSGWNPSVPSPAPPGSDRPDDMQAATEVLHIMHAAPGYGGYPTRPARSGCP